LRDWAPLLVWDTGAGLARREFSRSGQHVQTEGFDDLAQAVVRSLRAPDSGQIQLEWRSSVSGELRRTVVLEGSFGEPFAHAFQPAVNLIALGQTNGQIRVWDTRIGRAAGRLAGHRDSAVQVAFSPDGRTLTSTGADGSLRLWHLPTRREVATLLESGAKGPVGFSPDGTLLLAALLSDQVRAFRAPTLAQLAPAKHESP
jgi:WD40 repeat protein